MNVIVTGSSGQLGADVCACLADKGHTVFKLDLPQVDITDFSQVGCFFDALRALALKTPNILLYNNDGAEGSRPTAIYNL